MSQTNTFNAAKCGRRRRWGLVLLSLALLLVGAAAFLASRPWFVMAMIQPEMEKMLGGEVALDDARWIGLGRLKLSGVTVRVPDHARLPEPAGEIARIGQVTIDASILPLLVGRLSVRAMSFDDDVLLRLVEDAQRPGQYTFFELDPRIDVKMRRGARPPRIDLHHVILEAGEYEGDRYTVHGRRSVAGLMMPIRGDDETLTFELAEIDDRGHVVEDGLRISGRWDTTTLAHAARLDGLVLDEQTLAMCPQIVRLWWQHMELTGRVSEAKLDWTIGESFMFELAIEHVGLTLPEQVEAFLVRYHDGRIVEQVDRPRMELHSGVIRWVDDGVELENLEGRFLSGELDEDHVVHLPYRISLSIDELPAWYLDRHGEWLTHALEVAPFRMHVETSMDMTHSPDVIGQAGPSRAVDLPLPVARVLEELQLADWSIDTSVEIWREPLSDDDVGTLAAAPIEWRGHLYINDGSLRIPQFPYRLNHVEAALGIEQNVILVEELHASGAEQSRFTVDGSITLPIGAGGGADELGFDLNIVAVHLPLDENFSAALPERNRTFLDSLFAQSLYDSLDRASLMGDAADLDEKYQRLNRIETLLGETTPDPALLRERNQLIAQIERGPIKLGGNIHLDLHIHRNLGPDQPTMMTGMIEPDGVGVVFDRFPYPFTVVGGKLHWSPDRISIISDGRSNGLAIILPGGGRGVVTGKLDRPHIAGTRRLHPDLTFEIIGEPMNDLLAAVIPLTEHDRQHLPDANQWPGTTLAAPARLLQDIGLEGLLSTTGRIRTTRASELPANDRSASSSASANDVAATRIVYSFDIHLEHGAAQPTAELAELIGAAGLFWEDHFAVRNVQGHLTVSDKQIDLLGFHGWHGSGEVFAAGRIDRVVEPTTIALDVRLSDLDLHESLINLVPREGLATARELWERYEPNGRFTADLIFRETGEHRHPIKLIASPAVCEVNINGEPVSFVGLDGAISVTASEPPIVAFDNLRLNVRHGEADHGELLISGAYGVMDGENPLHVSGQWTNAAIESPVVLETMRLIGAERHQRWFAEHSPHGRVDAAFEYESAHGFPAAGPHRLRQLGGQSDDDGTSAGEKYRLAITPRELGLVLDETLIEAAFDDGSSILLTPGRVQFTSFAGRVGESTFQVNGDVHFDATIDAALKVDFRGRVASDEVMALFPPPARSVLRQLEFDDGDHTHVSQSRLSFTGMPIAGIDSGDDQIDFDWTVTYDGRLHLNGASMQIGVPATEVNGTLDLSLHVEPDAPPRVMMSSAFDSFRVIDRLITDLQADVMRLSDDGRTLVIPEIRGQSYGGMVIAEAMIGMGEHDRYELNIELAGLALGELYADHFERVTAANGGNAPQRSRTPRGEVFGGVKLAGQHGRPETRSGRGTIRAVGGNIDNIPILLQVFSVLQLNVPLRGSLDQANAEFYIDGDRIIFERILFESTVAEQIAAFQLIGQGVMDINTLEINAQFRSRGGMLVVRDIAGGLGDQLYLIEVRGTPAEPKARLLPLPWLLQPFSPTPGLGRAPINP
jgi:hypothetical protein